MSIENCHGCKWLDEVKSQPAGAGYCATVIRATGYQPGDRVRRASSPRCELYEEGDFATRWGKENSHE